MPLFACGADPHAPRLMVVDLIGKFRLAEARPARGAFSLAQHTLGGEPRASLQVPVPSRVAWTLPIPRRATLVLTPALPDSAEPGTVRFRIGVSDHRIYEALAEATLDAPPGSGAHATPLTIDLSAYAGLKWSIFHRPDERLWRLVLSTDPVNGPADRALWIEPGIYTDVPAARHYLHKRLTARR